MTSERIKQKQKQMYSTQQVLELMKQAFEAGFKKADTVEAGLEPKETEQEINWILTKFKNIVMVEFDENDLVNQDYENTTTKGDNPDYTAIRDRERVNKKERYEVVYFCNAFVKNYQVPKTKASFQKVEKIIRMTEASSIVMRDKLNVFVAQNWNKS